MKRAMTDRQKENLAKRMMGVVDEYKNGETTKEIAIATVSLMHNGTGVAAILAERVIEDIRAIA